jgi:hypothetical protein
MAKVSKFVYVPAAGSVRQAYTSGNLGPFYEVNTQGAGWYAEGPGGATSAGQNGISLTFGGSTQTRFHFDFRQAAYFGSGAVGGGYSGYIIAMRLQYISGATTPFLGLLQSNNFTTPGNNLQLYGTLSVNSAGKIVTTNFAAQNGGSANDATTSAVMTDRWLYICVEQVDLQFGSPKTIRLKYAFATDTAWTTVLTSNPSATQDYAVVGLALGAGLTSGAGAIQLQIAGIEGFTWSGGLTDYNANYTDFTNLPLPVGLYLPSDNPKTT